MASLNLLFASCLSDQRAQYAAYEPAGQISRETSKIKKQHETTIPGTVAEQSRMTFPDSYIGDGKPVKRGKGHAVQIVR